MFKTDNSNFYLRSSIFATLSIIGAAINYALYPILAHLLNHQGLGNFALIVATSNQILAILLAFNVTSISLVKNNPEKVAREKAQSIQKLLIWIFVALSVAVLALSPILNSRFKVDNPIYFFILTLLLLINVPAVIWTGYLQGHKRLINVGVYNFFGAFFKFILVIILGVSFGALGALWGVLIATAAAISLLWFSTNLKLPNLKNIFKKFSATESSDLSEMKLFIVQSILVVGGLGFLQNIDITYAKAFFNPDTAGVYSGISILSNAVYYVALLLVWIILPEINPRDPKNNKRVLTSAYKLMGTAAAVILILEILLKNHATKLLLGQSFASQGSVLIYATLFQISLVAITLYAFYLLVMRSPKSFILAACVILPCAILPWIFNDNPKQMITSLWLSTLIGIVLYCIINRFTRLGSGQSQIAD